MITLPLSATPLLSHHQSSECVRGWSGACPICRAQPEWKREKYIIHYLVILGFINGGNQWQAAARTED